MMLRDDGPHGGIVMFELAGKISDLIRGKLKSGAMDMSVIHPERRTSAKKAPKTGVEGHKLGGGKGRKAK